LSTIWRFVYVLISSTKCRFGNLCKCNFDNVSFRQYVVLKFGTPQIVIRNNKSAPLKHVVQIKYGKLSVLVCGVGVLTKTMYLKNQDLNIQYISRKGRRR
jgi:hypothetical protein